MFSMKILSTFLNQQNFIEIKKYFLDLLFPIQCIGCKKEGELLCKTCTQSIEQYPFPFCPICQRKLSGAETELQCENKNHSIPLSFVLAPTTYKNSLIKTAIGTYKYKKAKILNEPLANIILKTLNIYQWKNFCVTAVPLHPRTLRQRGFNQSELLAQKISSALCIPYIPLLKKVKHTKEQVELSSRERVENLKHAFTCENTEHIKGKYILLVDDVITTGTTLKECAKVLKENGAKKIGAVVVAR